jgi:hypothetical protein
MRIVRDVAVLKLDTPNRNGRVYPTDEVRWAITRLDRQLYGTVDPEAWTGSLEDASHFAYNPVISNGHLMCDIAILDTPLGHILDQYFDIMEFHPDGMGTVNPQGVVTNYELRYINAMPRGG